MKEVKYIPFMRSFFDASQKIKNKEKRLRFLESIMFYAFTGKEPAFTEDETEIDIVFTAIKPVIDNKKKQIETNTENISKRYDRSYDRSYGGSDIEIDREKERDIERDDDIESKNQSSSNFFMNSILSFCLNNELTLHNSTIRKLNTFMVNNNLDSEYLPFVFNYVLKEKPEADAKLKTACFVNKSFELAEDYTKSKEKRSKTKKEIPEHPSICPDCGKKLSACKTMENAWICKPCNKFYELKKGKWIWGS